MVELKALMKSFNMERFFLQSYSARSANPLGKLMDFLQEDVDSMQVGSTKLF